MQAKVAGLHMHSAGRLTKESQMSAPDFWLHHNTGTGSVIKLKKGSLPQHPVGQSSASSASGSASGSWLEASERSKSLPPHRTP